MSIIDEDIKNGKLNHIYLIYGEESFLRKQYKERLKKALSPEEDSMNYSYYEGKDISAGEIIDLAETMPFLAERRTIIIENSPFFKSEGEKIAEYLNAVPDTTYFVFVEESVDKRSKMYKSLAKNGCVVEAQGLSEDKLMTWILQLLKKDNKKITQNTMHYLLDKIGTNMENIRQEVEKLICYCYDKEVITIEDVDAVCTTQISNQIFEMLDAMANKRQKTALSLYYNLLALKEPPMRILFLIGRQFNLLLQARMLKQKGYGDRAIAEKKQR